MTWGPKKQCEGTVIRLVYKVEVPVHNTELLNVKGPKIIKEGLVVMRSMKVPWGLKTNVKVSSLD